MIMLRRHQHDAIAGLRDGFRTGCRRQILTMPTGAGKTAVAVQLARNARDKGHLAYMVVDRIELALQAAAAMRGAGLVLDAIHPDRLRDLVREQIESLLPAHQIRVLEVAEQSEREMLQLFARRAGE